MKTQEELESDVKRTTKRMREALDYVEQRLETRTVQNGEAETVALEEHLQVLSSVVNTWTSYISDLRWVLETDLAAPASAPPNPTTTIYTCNCGSESDDRWAATVHFMQCRSRWSENELTQDEYEAWQQARC